MITFYVVLTCIFLISALPTLVEQASEIRNSRTSDWNRDGAWGWTGMILVVCFTGPIVPTLIYGAIRWAVS